MIPLIVFSGGRTLGPMSETYTGRGTLMFNGEEHPCTYRLDTFVAGRMRSGDGLVEAAPSAIWSAFTADRAVVKMEDGRTFPIIITGNTNGATAPFKLAGALSDPTS